VTLRAAHVWCGPHRVWSPGYVRFDAAGRIEACGPSRGRATPWLIVPGLVNAHVHLQLPPLAGPRAFVPWLRAVIASRRIATAATDAVAHTVRALRQLLDSGCTAVGEIDSLGTSPAILRQFGVAGRCYQELLGFDVDAGQARAQLQRRRVRGDRDCPRGWSPHAPYSCSPALLRAASRTGAHLAMHVGESEPELELLQSGAGPFRDLLRDLGRWRDPYRAPGLTPVAWLAAQGALHARMLIVHAQHTSPADLARIAAARASVVVCPPTLRYFDRPAPPVDRWLAAGVNVALGTDSAASADGPLSMLATLASARRLWPGIAPEQILTMATHAAARAIGRPALGRIASGGRADLCCFRVPAGTSATAAIDLATRGELRLDTVWLAGRSFAPGHFPCASGGLPARNSDSVL
jgi:cytosine/adenosine deaminase-related metal-dependent hydrolase